MITDSPSATESEGERLGARLKVGDLVLLHGQLGAGKTTFVRGVSRACGGDAHVASPTFQLVRIYPGRLQLAHVDLYRIDERTEIAGLGLDELLDEGAVLVEWGERMPGARPSAAVTFTHLGDERRRLIFDPDLPESDS